VTNQYARFKHWFQDGELSAMPDDSAVVVAMFRDPYNWVEAMRVEPHHAHEHIRWNSTTIDYEKGWHAQGGTPLEWKEFVTKPWYMERGPVDRNIADANARREADCIEGYSFGDVVPCTPGDAGVVEGLGDAKYELRPNGSERAYSSVIELRRDNILNHLSVADFEGTRAFFPYRFEDLNSQGTGGLLKSLEEATGFKARCEATMGRAPKNLRERRRLKPIVYHDELPDDYIQWMSQYVDWEVESQIGNFPRQ